MADFDSALKIRQDAAADLNATTVGAGAAGTANPGVHTIQGIAGMVPVLVSAVDADLSGVPLGTAASGAFGDANGLASGATAAAAVAATAVVPAGKTGYVRGFYGSGSGLTKFTLMIGATFATAVVADLPIYGSLGNLNPSRLRQTPIAIPAGSAAFISGTNRDKLAQDLHADIDAYVTT